MTAFDACELAMGIDAEKSSFARATCLTEQGIEEAKLIGNVLKLSNVKIAHVVSSPSARAVQTARHDREETGSIVLEKEDGQIIARHKFPSVKDFTTAIIELDPR